MSTHALHRKHANPLAWRWHMCMLSGAAIPPLPLVKPCTCAHGMRMTARMPTSTHRIGLTPDLLTPVSPVAWPTSPPIAPQWQPCSKPSRLPGQALPQERSDGTRGLERLPPRDLIAVRPCMRLRRDPPSRLRQTVVSCISMRQSIWMPCSSDCDTGQRDSCQAKARSAAARVPSGMVRAYRRRTVVRWRT